MIDWFRVTELRDEIGAEDFEEVVEIFLEEVEGVLDKLRADDRSELEQDLHFLKGSALNLGFQAFSEKCQEGERLSSQGQADTVNLVEIVALYESSKTNFLQELPNKY